MPLPSRLAHWVEVRMSQWHCSSQELVFHCPKCLWAPCWTFSSSVTCLYKRETNLLDLPTTKSVYNKQTSNTHILCRQPHPSANWSFGDDKKTPRKKEYDEGLTLIACTLGCMDKSDEPTTSQTTLTSALF